MFKDMIDADRTAVFLDVDTFGELAIVEGNEIPIVIDNDQLKIKQSGQEYAIAESNTLLYARTEDLPPKRIPGQNININGRECLIDDWIENNGVVTLILRENIV